MEGVTTSNNHSGGVSQTYTTHGPGGLGGNHLNGFGEDVPKAEVFLPRKCV